MQQQLNFENGKAGRRLVTYPARQGKTNPNWHLRNVRSSLICTAKDPKVSGSVVYVATNRRIG